MSKVFDPSELDLSLEPEDKKTSNPSSEEKEQDNSQDKNIEKNITNNVEKTSSLEKKEDDFDLLNDDIDSQEEQEIEVSSEKNNIQQKNNIQKEEDIQEGDILNDDIKKEENTQENNLESSENNNENAHNIDSNKINNESNNLISEDKIEIDKDAEKIIADNTKEYKKNVLEKEYKIDAKKDEEKQIAKVSIKETWEDIKEEEKVIDYDILKETENTSNKLKTVDFVIKNLDDIIDIMIKSWAEFFTIEPKKDKAEVNFKKSSKIIETRYIDLIVYSKAIFKVKTDFKFDIEEEKEEQSIKKNIKYKSNNYKASVKTIPWPIWEKLYFKLSIIKEKVASKKKKEPISISKVLGFLAWIMFIVLVFLAAFLTFVVLNAKTPADVALFTQLWINLWEINKVIKSIILIVFTFLAFVESIFLFISLYKTIFTKKQYAKKKFTSWIVSVFIFFILIWTASTWLFLHRQQMPDWYKISLWNIQIFDNDKLLESSKNIETALVWDVSRLLWPITLKYNLENFAQQKALEWFIIDKYIWDFWNKDVVTTTSPEIIKEFTEKWFYDVKLVVEWTKSSLPYSAPVGDVSSVNIYEVVQYNERILPNSWKIISFNASALTSQWDIDWYFFDDNSQAELVYTWWVFKPWKVFFWWEKIWMVINKPWVEETSIDKLFIIKWNNDSNISWEIEFIRDINNDLKYSLSIKDAQTEFWTGIIERFQWIIWDDIKTIDNVDISSPEAIIDSSRIEYTFWSYWNKEIKAKIFNSNGKFREISKTIEMNKILWIKNNILMYLDWEKYDYSWRYSESTREFDLQNLSFPSTLNFDARRVKPDSIFYRLNSVKWDTNWDWEYDKSSKRLDYDINKTGFHKVWILYEFINKNDSTDIIEVSQAVLIEAIEKDAIIDFKIVSDSSYVPVVVWFDASKSKVKDDDIVKFIFDYWDWTSPEVRWDAINPGHKYYEPWEYDITLTAVTANWNRYSKTKKMILKPKPDKVEISSSLKKAPINQSISFFSNKSNWQIKSYFWDFWDWNSTREANPEHFYTKSWKYRVILKAEFQNRNILEDEYEIEITK